MKKKAKDLKPLHDKVKLDECETPLYVKKVENDLMFGMVRLILEDDWFTLVDGDAMVPVYN